MSFFNSAESSLWSLLFNNTAFANLGDATGLRGSSAAGSLYVSLHTADPGEAGDQSTSEAAYTGYSRVAVERSADGWTVANNQVSNTAQVQFGEVTAGSETITHFVIGGESAGAGTPVLRGVLAASGATWKLFTAKTDDTITIPGNPFSVDDRVVFQSLAGSTLPTGITEGTVYWVKTVSGDDITISATEDGAAIDVTAVGSGACIQAKPVTVSAAGASVPTFSAGQLVAYLD